MAKYSIISKDGATVRYTGYPRYSGTYMGVPFLEFSEITSPVPIAWEIGDYVEYRGMQYFLYSLPEPKKQARRGEYGAAFVYNGVQFHSAVKDLEIALFRDIVADDNEMHFSTMPDVSTYEDVHGIARRINACLDDLFPGKWTIEVYQSEDTQLNALLAEVKEYVLNNGTCLDALSLIYDTWQNIGWIHTYEGGKNVITIARANVRDASNTTPTFGYGKGAGLTAIKRASANKEEFATRLYVYGSDRNIPPRYYNSKNIKDAESVYIPNLMLPIDTWGKTNGVADPRLSYLEAEADIIRKYGIIPRVVRFDGNERDEIFPSIEGLAEKDVRKAMIDGGQEDNPFLPGDNDVRIDEVLDAFVPDDGYIANSDGTSREEEVESTFTLEINNIGFDINQQASLANEQGAIISMKSGACAGREFSVKEARWDGGTWVLTVERQLDESLNMLLPNFDYLVKQGDRFVILDIAMPDYYVTLAQQRLYNEGMKVLADYTRTSAFYEPQIDAKLMYTEGISIKEGMYMRVVDEDVIDTEQSEDYVLIDSLSIDEKTEIPTYNVTLSEQKRSARGFAALENMIEDAREVTSKEVEDVRKTSQRRFSSVQETISMLQAAFEGFAPGINPVTVQTMTLVAGDGRSQFTFTSSRDSIDSVPCPVYYDSATKRVVTNASFLVHFTIGIDSVTAPNVRKAEDYRSWILNADNSQYLDDGSIPYYVCIRAEKEGDNAYLYVTDTPMPLEADGNYYFYVGILNSESGGTRDFATIYGFTEVAPGRIVTNVIRSADGSCYFDLENNEIGGRIKFLAGSEGVENLMADVTVGGENMLRNSGFTGDYLSERLADDIVLDATSQMYNNPLAYWTGSVNVKVNEDEQSESGRSVTIFNGVLTQQLYHKTIAGEKYILSFKAKGLCSLSVTMGGTTYILAIDSEEYKRYTYAFEAAISTPGFVMVTSDTTTICEIQLERGTVPTAWSNSFLDNSSDRAYYQALKYLSDAIKGTTIIDGGLILTNHMKLGEYSEDQFVERAGVSGLYADDDSPAFWAGGTVAQAEELLKRIAEGNTDLDGLADFVVTHGGMAVLRNMVFFANSGMVGGLTITPRGLEVATQQGGKVVISDGGVILYDINGDISGSLGYCGGSAISAVGRGGIIACPKDEEQTGVYASSGKSAFFCNKGRFVGLRTATSVISTSGGTTVDDPRHRIDELDSNVLVNMTSGVCYLSLTTAGVASVEDGQEYIIESMGAALNIITGSDNIYDMTTGVKSGYTNSPFTREGRGAVRLKYYKEIDTWTCTTLS